MTSFHRFMCCSTVFAAIATASAVQASESFDIVFKNPASFSDVKLEINDASCISTSSRDLIHNHIIPPNTTSPRLKAEVSSQPSCKKSDLFIQFTVYEKLATAADDSWEFSRRMTVLEENSIFKVREEPIAEFVDGVLTITLD